MKLIWIMLLSIFSISTHCSESGFDDVKLLTDEEQVEANEYYHAGLAQERKDQACAESDLASDLCTNSQSGFNTKGMQTLEMMIPMVSKAYSMILGNTSITMGTGEMVTKGTGDDVLTYTKNDEGQWVNKQLVKEDGKAAEVVESKPISADEMTDMEKSGEVTEKTEKKRDYCAMIPMASEMGAQIYMTMQNNEIEQQYQQADPAYKQKESLYAVQNSQMAQKKASIVQTAGWGVTSACYVGYMIAGGYTDPMLYAKLAASALIATFYGFKIAAHQNRADGIQEILDGFPDQGECNPHTQTTCFCSHSSSMSTDPGNYQKVCVPPPFASRFNQDPFACVDAGGKSDPNCLCAQNNTCIDAALKSGFAKLGLNPNSLAGPLKALEPLTKGTGAGELGNAHQQNMAMARKALNKFAPKKLPSFNLSPDQKKLAREMTNLGIPAAAAAMIAAQPVKAAPAGASLAGLKGDGKFGNGNIGNNGKNSKMSFSGGSRGSSGRFKTSSRNNDRSNSKGGSGGGDVVLIDDLQRKAASRAEINHDSGKNIFDIITYRYNMSAWKRFEDTITKEIKAPTPSSPEEDSKE